MKVSKFLLILSFKINFNGHDYKKKNQIKSFTFTKHRLMRRSVIQSVVIKYLFRLQNKYTVT